MVTLFFVSVVVSGIIPLDTATSVYPLCVVGNLTSAIPYSVVRLMSSVLLCSLMIKRSNGLFEGLN